MSDAAALLLAARRDPSQRLAALPEALRPVDRAAAYAIQHAIAGETGPIGGWKVSPFGADGSPPMCGPLPASGIQPAPAATARRHAAAVLPPINIGTGCTGVGLSDTCSNLK